MHVKRERPGHLAVPGSPPVRRYGPPQPPLQPFPLCQTLLDRGIRVPTLNLLPRVGTKTLSNRETGSGTRRGIFVLKFQLENHLYFLIKSSIPDFQAGWATMSAN